jgi:predicted AlkP superfamily phosphohydrolase/phosphomutase
VFDGTDRIQHMFWRDIDAGHPAARGREKAAHRNAIRDLYEHNDALVGRAGAAAALKAEIAARLKGLRDEEKKAVGINEAFDTAALYSGPYLENAPDLVIGYNAGYRISWDCATGMVAGPVFEDNRKPWSGDHCVDPRLVPGVFFCNRKVDAEQPALIDIAPTALRLFGIEPPPYMDGKPIAGLA